MVFEPKGAIHQVKVYNLLKPVRSYISGGKVGEGCVEFWKGE